MTTRRQYIKHVFAGGWATDLGPSSNVGISQGGIVALPFLVDAKNVQYEFDGGPHKMGGTTKLNSVALESGAAIRGLYDYWISGSGGSSTQHRIVYVNDSIYKDDGNGTFAQIKSGLEAGKVANFSTFDDLLIIATSSTTDVPMSWDGTTFQNLAGSPPNFAFSVEHKNRQWAAGVASTPSTLYYSAFVNPEDWTGQGSGSILISPDDGDRIMAIASYKNELWVFKGPYRGSIHRIFGSSPTGSDPFGRATFVDGLGATGANSLFTFRDDLAFVCLDGTVRSLQATAAFGDFNEATLSLPITNWIRDHVNFGRLNQAGAVNIPNRGYGLFSLAIDGATENNAILYMDYRFEPVRWALWDAIDAISIARVVDSGASNGGIAMIGGDDGFVRKTDQPTRSIDGSTAISAVVTTPFLDYGDAVGMKTISAASLGVAPKNNGDVTLGWQGDDRAQQTIALNQDAGGALDSFVLGTDVLGGARFVDRFVSLEEGGEFRAIQYQVTNSTNNEDVEIHNIGAALESDAWSLEN